MEKDGDRDGRVAGKNQPRENSPGRRQPGREFFITQSERLEKARSAMAKVKSKEEHPQDVKAGDEIILKTVNHHRIDVVAIERIGFQEKETGIRHAHGEMGEVIQNESENNQAAQRHRA